MDFNYVFYSGHFTCGSTLYKKMRHFCDIGLHPLLDYNDLTLNKITPRRFQQHLQKAPLCGGISFHLFIFTYSPAFAIT